MNPKFSEGEIVILQSVSCSQYNGEYQVEKALFYNETVDCRLDDNARVSCDGPVGYIFTEPLKDPDDTTEIIWAESALRKKHQPVELSFQELMETFKTEICVN